MKLLLKIKNLRRNLVKVLLFYIAFHVIYLCLKLLFSTSYLQLFTVKEMSGYDFTFNDLYYRIVASENFEGAKNFRKEKSCILINTGTLDRHEFRVQLAALLIKLESFYPKIIAIDHEFRKDSLIPGSDVLLSSLSFFDNVIYAFDPYAQSLLELPGIKGSVILPNQNSIRYYSSDTISFAYQITRLYKQKKISLKLPQDSFAIHYSSYDIGFVNWRDELNPLYDINFKAVEAIDVLQDLDTSQMQKLKNLMYGKIIILGHLGNPHMYHKFDVEDKFKAPTDPLHISDRERILAGPVIHANAVENLLDPENMFYECRGFWFDLLQQFFYLLYISFSLFYRLDNLRKKLVLGILSLMSIIFVLYLMEFNIYLTMGTTLLQLLVIEEISEMFEPYYLKLEKYYFKYDIKGD
jgi:hypothetical protein